MAFRIKIGYVTIAVTYVATELSILLGCQPFYKNWQINPDPGSKSISFELEASMLIVDRLLPACYFENRSLRYSGAKRSDRHVSAFYSFTGMYHFQNLLLNK